MVRALVPAALVVLIGVQVLFAPPEKDEPVPAKGTLTLNLEGDEGWKEPEIVKVSAMGDPPTTASTLRDVTGRHTATISPVAATECPDTMRALVAIAGGTADWCLRAEKVAAGHELSGEIKGTGGVITMTINRRDAFTPGPAAWLALGLFLGLLVILVPVGLRRVVRWIVLNRLLARNRQTPEDRQISGLKEWVQGRLDAGATHDEAIAAANEMLTHGPRRAAGARTELAAQLKKSTLPAGHPFRVGAAKEADKGTKPDAEKPTHAATDFYNGNGEERKQHPAAEWLAGLERMDAHQDELARREKEIEDTIEPGDRTEPNKQLNEARQTFDRIEKPSKVTRMDKRLDDLITAIEDAQASALPEEERRRWQMGRAAAGADRRARGGLETVIPLGLSAGTLAGWTFFATLGTAVVVAVTVIFAWYTVKTAAYEPKLTFNSFEDYFALFSAALGSGAAASVLAIVGYWSASGEAADA